LLIVLPISVLASNSLIKSEDISKMKKAGVSQNIIDYVITHQTCSIDAATVIQYHKAGLKENEIVQIIKSDAYRPERESTIEKELKIIEGLKLAGFSDLAILEYMNMIRSNQLIDVNGNRTYRVPPIKKFNKHDKHHYQQSPYPLNLEINK
jgi:hypothetical protein